MSIFAAGPDSLTHYLVKSPLKTAPQRFAKARLRAFCF